MSRPRITVAPEGKYFVVLRNNVVVGRYDTSDEAIRHKSYAARFYTRRANAEAKRVKERTS